jgi:hypothetical protein
MSNAAPDQSDEFDERLRTAARSAVDDVNSLNLSPSDRPVVLGLILATRLGLVSGVAAAVSAAPVPAPASAAVQTVKAGAPIPEGDLIAKIAAALKLDHELAERIYDVKDGELGYVISARRLAADKANATRQLAAIVAAGRQAAGLEDWTPVSVVREVVHDFGKLDAANFAGYIAKLDKDDAYLVRGKGANREIKVTRSGLDPVGELLTSLLSV